MSKEGGDASGEKLESYDKELKMAQEGKQKPLFLEKVLPRPGKGRWDYDPYNRQYRDRVAHHASLYTGDKQKALRAWSEKHDNVLDWSHIDRFYFLELLEKHGTKEVNEMLYTIAYNTRPYQPGW